MGSILWKISYRLILEYFKSWKKIQPFAMKNNCSFKNLEGKKSNFCIDKFIFIYQIKILFEIITMKIF